MTISFIIPYVPIPRIVKRMEIAKKIDSTNLIYWDRGTESSENIFNDPDIQTNRVFIQANEGNPFQRLKQTFNFSIEVYKHLKINEPDIIHVTKTDMLFVVYIYCMLSKNNPKVVYEVSDIHKYALNDKKNIIAKTLEKILYIIERKCFNIVDRLIVTSPYFWSNYYKKIISKDKVLYLANTPNENIFKTYEYKKKDKFTVAFIGKVRYVEQIKMLIDVAEQIGINVLIAGNGIGYEEIKAYSINKEFVKMWGAYNYKQEIAKLYSYSDAVYSVYDTSIENVKIALPNRLYEAAYCGLPLIVSKNTYLESVVINNGLGVSVNPYDKKNLSTEINKIINKDYLYKVKENGKLFYSKNNDVTNNNKLYNLYLNLNSYYKENN